MLQTEVSILEKEVDPKEEEMEGSPPATVVAQ